MFKRKVYYIDFETYYDKDYSLSKMTTAEYVHDPQFKTHMVGILTPAWAQPVVHTIDIQHQLDQLDLPNNIVVAHNATFDCMILREHYGIVPGLMIDTLAVSRAVTSPEAPNHSLDGLCQFYGIKGKLPGLSNSKGHRKLPHTVQQELINYCSNDVTITRQLLTMMMTQFPTRLLRLQDAALRMAVEPQLHLNPSVLKNAFEAEELAYNNMEKLLRLVLNITPSHIRSNEKFAHELSKHGIEPPVKLSPTTGKEIFAFARTDSDFMLLEHHDNQKVRLLHKARIQYKSTQAMTRAERYMKVAACTPDHDWPVGIGFSGAMTTKRWSGNMVGGGNPQNLRRGSKLREAIVAPKDHVIIAGDSSQIELRVNRRLAGYHKTMNAMHSQPDFDLYKDMAADIFDTHVQYVTPDQRFIGKQAELSLQYQASPARFDDMCIQQGINLSSAGTDAVEVVRIWRSKWEDVCNLWTEAQKFVRTMGHGAAQEIVRDICDTAGLEYQHRVNEVNRVIGLPSGLSIKYPGLRQQTPEHGMMQLYSGFDYVSGRGRTKIYGGKVIENWSQALANCVLEYQLSLMLKHKLRPAMFVHDEFICVVHKNDIEEVKEIMTRCLCSSPPWWGVLLTDCEIGVGDNYAECK